jgi:hypothetical protein
MGRTGSMHAEIIYIQFLFYETWKERGGLGDLSVDVKEVEKGILPK